MKTLLPILALLTLAGVASACDGIAFSSGACYSQAVVAQAYAPVQQYCAPQAYAAPAIQSYAAPAQYFAAPARVAIIKPEVRLELSQVQAYAYAAPVQVIQKQLAVKSYAAPVFVQKQYAAPQVIVQQAPRLRIFGGGRSVQRSFSRSVIRN